MLRPAPLLLLLAASCGKDKPVVGDSAQPGDTREPCTVQVPERQLLWGDLHVHTAYSFDAWVYDVRTTPDEATRFAKGEPLLLPPLDADGVGTRSLQLQRPLDFVAITDHADLMGEVQACIQPDSAAYETDFCEGYRAAERSSIQAIASVLANAEPEHLEVCEVFDCEAATVDAWEETQAVAEAHYDRSGDCSFTTFVGYEWTAATGVSNYHRNVLFGSATVPASPITYFDRSTAQGLWEALDRDCLQVDGCDVIAIPHNSDMSNGRQFTPAYSGDEVVAATLRRDLEPLLEIYQHKGDSECRNGLAGILGSEDEACGFEKQRDDTNADCGDSPGAGAMAGFGCMSQLDYLRGILLEGLREEERIGVNPYRLGVVASTDTHSGAAGYVEEDAFIGHLGGFEDDAEERLVEPGLTPGGFTNSPGGLVAAWSVSNDRDALFASFRRREVYGTSGPRISLRFFGGPDLPADVCDDPELLSTADATGVPMGGELDRGDGRAPTFVVSALQDPGTTASPGVPLERVQIVKGWLDAAGERHVEVFDVAGGEHEVGVDLDTCTPQGEGYTELCATWTDPGFDAKERAWYYARVLQNPTCRWSTYDCLSYDATERPEACDTLAPTIQERAWSSPIWF